MKLWQIDVLFFFLQMLGYWFSVGIDCLLIYTATTMLYVGCGLVLPYFFDEYEESIALYFEVYYQILNTGKSISENQRFEDLENICNVHSKQFPSLHSSCLLTF